MTKSEFEKLAGYDVSNNDYYTDYNAINELNKQAEEYKEKVYASGFIINSKYTLEHLGDCRGCSYPASIEFYNSCYHEIDRIKLV